MATQKRTYDKDDVNRAVAAYGGWERVVLQTVPESRDAIQSSSHVHCFLPGHEDHDPSFRIEQNNGEFAYYCVCSKGNAYNLIAAAKSIPYADAINLVGELVGAEPTKGKRRKSDDEPPDPAKNLEFRGVNQILFGLWCLNKPPITVEAIVQAGGQLATYRKRWQVIAFPVRRPATDDVIGWVITPLNGKTLPTFDREGNVTAWVKVKTMPGTRSGLIGVQTGGKHKYFLEGPTNLLAFTSQGLAPDEDAVCNVHGAKEDPHRIAGLEEYVTDSDCVIDRDADRAGEEGAAKWGAFLATHAQSCRVVIPPFERAISKGKDLRDWFAEGHTRADYDELVGQAEVITPPGELVKVNEAADDPHRLARINLERYSADNNGAAITSFQDEFYTWKRDRNHYKVIPLSNLTAKLNAAIRREFDRLNRVEIEEYNDWLKSDDYDEAKDKGPPKAKKVTRRLVNDVLDAMRGMLVMSSDIGFGSWLISDPPFGADSLVVVRNGLIHLPSLVAGNPAMIPPTPDYFSVTAVPFDFDAAAQCPRWIEFLNSLWPKDAESIATLQQWFGYVISRETEHQKILAIVGPKRSGKGTIARILTSIIGSQNVTNPSLSKLGSTFGLQELYGKTLAILTDARLSGRVDSVEVVEQLLSISGEDAKNIDRKYKDALTNVKMGARFMLMANEIPRFKDASGAIASRVIVLRQRRSFLGKEDHTLHRKLLGELPGILNWSINGWRDLTNAGRFAQPKSGRDDLRSLEELASPTLAFIRECCVVKNPKAIIRCDELFSAWKAWCAKDGRDRPGTMASFGRDLRAACPSIKRVRPGKRDTQRTWHYRGIALKSGGSDAF